MEIAPAIIPNDIKVNIAGPWSDIWSFGVLVMNMLYGTNQRRLTKEVTIIPDNYENYYNYNIRLISYVFNPIEQHLTRNLLK